MVVTPGQTPPGASEREQPSENRKPPGAGKTDLDWLAGLPEGRWSAFGLVVLVLFALVLAGVARRAREALPSEGALPTLVGLVHIGFQLVVVLTSLAIVARLLPASVEPVVPWALVAGAVAVGWSARELLPDLVGALVIAFERRVRPGTWVSGLGFAGLVERRGLRAVWIRDGHGNRLAVPNRHVVGTTVTMQLGGGPVHEVALRLRTGRPARDVRKALREATLISPWVRPEAAPQIRQDGSDPELWHVRAHLLEMRYAAAFEGDLLERAEESLAAAAALRAAEDWD